VLEREHIACHFNQPGGRGESKRPHRHSRAESERETIRGSPADLGPEDDHRNANHDPGGDERLFHADGEREPQRKPADQRPARVGESHETHHCDHHQDDLEAMVVDPARPELHGGDDRRQEQEQGCKHRFPSTQRFSDERDGHEQAEREQQREDHQGDRSHRLDAAPEHEEERVNVTGPVHGDPVDAEPVEGEVPPSLAIQEGIYLRQPGEVVGAESHVTEPS
jgi:hypothetical protein